MIRLAKSFTQFTFIVLEILMRTPFSTVTNLYAASGFAGGVGLDGRCVHVSQSSVCVRAFEKLKKSDLGSDL